MRIAYLHYHLKTGGVTTVIRQQIEAVKGDCDTLVFSGSAPEEKLPAKVFVVDGLSYDSDLETPRPPAEVAGAVLELLHRRWPDGCDLLHVHNPTLAKNRNFLEILRHLQDAGIRLLCQVHDFAEDGRPHVYYTEPYPKDCHWAAINGRDYRLLQAAGLDSAGVHFIPNTVSPLPCAGDAGGAKKRILYPVRAIRRKNIGEALLLSLFFPLPAVLSITRPPNSPADLASYRDWKDFACSRGLPVEFEAGMEADFAELVGQSRMLLTTSVTEGFGFSFLEAWTAGKLLWGRKLSEICQDFEKDGVRLDHLYTRLSVPAAWLEETGFQKRWCACYSKSLARFQRPAPKGEIQNALAVIQEDGTVDFGLLDEGTQRHVIETVLDERSRRTSLVEGNPFLAGPGALEGLAELIDHNRRTVLARYALDVYRKRLLETYRRAATRQVRHAVDKSVLLDFFLRPQRFSLLKWCPYDR